MSPARDMPPWSKAPEDLQRAFHAALEGFPDAERRQTFGYPAAFANGNMWTGLHQGNWVVRLPDAARAELLGIDGSGPFEPVPGRPMTGFAVLPPDVVSDPDQLHHWLGRAFEHGLAMAPKTPKSGKGPKPRP